MPTIYLFILVYCKIIFSKIFALLLILTLCVAVQRFLEIFWGNWKWKKNEAKHKLSAQICSDWTGLGQILEKSFRKCSKKTFSFIFLAYWKVKAPKFLNLPWKLVVRWVFMVKCPCYCQGRSELQVLRSGCLV